MTRLYVVCEGLTEINFVTQLLKPYLEAVNPERLTVNAPRAKERFTYAEIRKFIRNLLGSPGSQVVVTTMVDLFKLPGDFPGLAEASALAPLERVRQLEQDCTRDVGDRRFFAYLQLHEFEALLLADLTVLAEQHPNRRKSILELAVRLNKKFPSPEHVNRVNPPSRRIKDEVPEYSKTVDGPITTARIGLSKLRERCPHFGDWLSRLEDVAASLTPRPTRSPD
jgi:hypothetical protein